MARTHPFALTQVTGHSRPPPLASNYQKPGSRCGAHDTRSVLITRGCRHSRTRSEMLVQVAVALLVRCKCGACVVVQCRPTPLQPTAVAAVEHPARILWSAISTRAARVQTRAEHNEDYTWLRAIHFLFLIYKSPVRSGGWLGGKSHDAGARICVLSNNSTPLGSQPPAFAPTHGPRLPPLPDCCRYISPP